MAHQTPHIHGSHIYDHLGIVSNPIDDQSGETLMQVGPDIRTPGGLRVAPLGLAFENGVATYLFARVFAVPIEIALHVRDGGDGTAAIRSLTRTMRQGRTLVVTDGEIRDLDHPERLIAFGSITWSVTGEAPPGERAQQPRRELVARETPSAGLLETVGVTALADGSGCQLPGVSPQIAGPGGILHAGMFQLLSEEAALVTARATLGTDRVFAADCAFHFLQAGRTGPFVASSEVIHAGDDGVDCRVQVRDDGNEGRVAAYSLVRVRPSI